MSGAAPWRARAGGLIVLVRLTPKGGRDAIEGIETLSDGRAALKARVRAAPEDGKANDALTRLIAAAAGVARSAVSIAAGHTSRIKTVEIRGEPERIAAALGDTPAK
ncbi:MAG: DUF167 domain-containing protein [Hyphomicrobiales bacterium]|nr:DUF167 domain-containing protein [Hyphomicrobiales bacterium]